jgi:uncharacterized protein YcbK (DUF882 family)
VKQVEQEAELDLPPAKKLNHRRKLQRRSFIKLGVFSIAATTLSPLPVLAGVKRLLQDTRELAFYNLHTEERLNVCYCRKGIYDPEALKAVNYILRDHRSGEIHTIDRRLLDLLHTIANQIGSPRFHVISGYRSPVTNSMLRQDGREVASRSLHTLGQAIDIRMPDADTQALYQVAVDLKGGGVGHYPGRNFVHVDVGRVRYW